MPTYEHTLAYADVKHCSVTALEDIRFHDQIFTIFYRNNYNLICFYSLQFINLNIKRVYEILDDTSSAGVYQ